MRISESALRGIVREEITRKTSHKRMSFNLDEAAAFRALGRRLHLRIIREGEGVSDDEWVNTAIQTLGGWGGRFIKSSYGKRLVTGALKAAASVLNLPNATLGAVNIPVMNRALGWVKSKLGLPLPITGEQMHALAMALIAPVGAAALGSWTISHIVEWLEGMDNNEWSEHIAKVPEAAKKMAGGEVSTPSASSGAGNKKDAKPAVDSDDSPPGASTGAGGPKDVQGVDWKNPKGEAKVVRDKANSEIVKPAMVKYVKDEKLDSKSAKQQLNAEMEKAKQRYMAAGYSPPKSLDKIIKAKGLPAEFRVAIAKTAAAGEALATPASEAPVAKKKRRSIINTEPKELSKPPAMSESRYYKALYRNLLEMGFSKRQSGQLVLEEIQRLNVL